MLKGISQWSFPDGTGVEAMLAQCVKAGFDAIELAVGKPGAVGLTTETTEKEALRIKAMANHQGIRLSSLASLLLWEHPISAGDPAVRDRGKQILAKQLELAAAIGADTILVIPGIVDRDTTYEACYARSQDVLGSLVPLAERLGVSIGVENVWNKFLLSPTEMIRFIDEFNSPSVGAYFDVGNVLLTGYPEHWIASLGSRIRKVHVKDFNVKVGTLEGFVPLLSGHVNWGAVRKALVDITYDDTITAELMPPYPEAPEQMIMDAARQVEWIISGKVG